MQIVDHLTEARRPLQKHRHAYSERIDTLEEVECMELVSIAVATYFSIGALFNG